MAKVLVLGEDARIMLPIFRSLGSRGIEIHCGWCPGDSAAVRSRFLYRRHDLPPFAAECNEWHKCLRALHASERFDLIIPATEAAAYPLHIHRDRAELIGSIYLLSPAAFEATYNKALTYALAERLGVPIPRTVAVTNQTPVDEQISQLHAPYVVKSSTSVRSSRTLDKNFVLRAANEVEVRSHCEHLLSAGESPLVQELVPGEGIGVEMLLHEGKVLRAFQHRRLHETSGFGSTYRESVSIDPKLLDACELMMGELRYTGVAMAEFRVESTSGRWALLEINARFWGSLPLAIASGADFPFHLYQLLVEGIHKFDPAYRIGIRSRNLLNDCRWMWRSLRGMDSPGQGENVGWGMNHISRWQLLKDFGRLLLGRDYLDTFTWRDPAPAIAEFKELLSNVALKGKRLAIQRLETRTATHSG